MPDWMARLTQQLEPALAAIDPRAGISAQVSAYESNRLARTGFEPVAEPTSLNGVTPSAVVVVATRGSFAF